MTATDEIAWRRRAALVAAFVATVCCVHFSEIGGRLAYDMQYDDVVYADDAAARLELLWNHGLSGFLHSFSTFPAHSLYSTLLAVVAFVAFGMHDWALYAANFLLVAAIALGVASITRSRSRASYLLAQAIVLTAPISYFAITEFRPDIALGLATTAMAWVFIGALVDQRPVATRGAGLLLAIALCIKPTFFAHTLAIAVGLSALGLVLRLAPGTSEVRRHALRSRDVIHFFAIGILLAAPYYAVSFDHVFGYFWTNALGKNASIWNYSRDMAWAGLVERFRDFMFLLDRWHGPAALAAALIAGALLALRVSAREALRVFGLLAVALLSAVIIVSGRQPSHFFFATVHGLLLTAAVHGWAVLAQGFAPVGRRLAVVAVVFAVVLLATLNTAITMPAGQEPARVAASWNQRAIEWIREDAATHPRKVAKPLHLFVGTAGPVNAMTLRWVARKSHLRVEAEELYLISDVGQLQDWARAADYVVIAVPALSPYDHHLPIARAQGELVTWLGNDGRFELLNRGPAREYLVFANRAKDAL